MTITLRRAPIEICVVVGCFLVVFLTVMQIIALTHKSKYRGIPSTFEAGAVTVKYYNLPTTDERRHNSAKEKRLAVYLAKVKLKKKIQMEIQALKVAMTKMLKEKSPTPEESNTNIDNDLYARRIRNIITKSESRSLNISRSHAVLRGSYNKPNKSAHMNITNKVPYRAQRFGLPLSFVSTSSPQEISNTDFMKKNKSKPFKHFQDLNKSEENQLENILRGGKSFEDGNFSTQYEDNFNKIQRQFQRGTELYVNEDLLRQQYIGQQDICPQSPESLVGNTTDIQFNQTLDIDSIVYNNSDVLDGGEWKPTTCIARYRVAIIIPYRDRWNHLKVLLHYLIPTLKRQQIHFRIFVVEQFGNETFNKGRIMNAAFREALKLFDFQCVTFHDVDLVPEDDRNMYTCTEQPKHMSHSIDKFKYILPYQGLVGGVLMFKREQFQRVNGYSNMYWGWGAEDDDMTTRILYHGLRIYRPPSTIAKYKMVKHDGRKSSEVAVRMRLLRSAARRSRLEGLNNVKYTLLSAHIEKLFTHFIVNIGTP